MKTLITDGQLRDHLVCPHRVVMEAFGDPAERGQAEPRVAVVQDQPCLDLSALRGEAKEAATRAALVRAEPLIRGGRLSVHELQAEPDLLRREGRGYVAIVIGTDAAQDDEDEQDGSLIDAVRLALHTDILEQMGLAAGRYGYLQAPRGGEIRCELAKSRTPRDPCTWETYLKARQALRETLALPPLRPPPPRRACRRCAWQAACSRARQPIGAAAAMDMLEI